MLDLSHARTVAESFMIDRCVVKRDPEGTLDDELNEDLEYEDDPADATTIYSGKCLLGTSQRREARGNEGGQSVHRRVHRMRFPLSAPLFHTGDIVTMTVSPEANSNAQLVGQVFRVVEANDRSLAASRIVILEDWAGAKAR